MNKENPTLYAYGCKHGWTKTTKWPKGLTRRYYSEEQLKKEVFESSRRFHSRGEFQKNDCRNYCVALRRGWLDEMHWLETKENPFTDRINYIYLYLFEEQKTFYVGETFHGSQRHNEHLRRGPVFNFAKENGIEIPKPIILEDNLNRLNEVRRQEHYWKLHYISLGYNTLNKGKTGEHCGSLGSASIKWTRKTCRKAALQCQTRYEFFKKFRGAYQAVSQHGWWKDYTWLVPLTGTTPKRVLQYTKDGRLVGKFESFSLAAKAVSGNSSNISHCCLGNIKSAYGFVWKYEET